MMKNDLHEIGKRVLASQPFSVLLGAELLSLAAGLAVIRVPVTPDVRQQHGHVHGGVLSYAADNALAFAGGSVLGPGVVTSEFKINYLRPAAGDSLVARAGVVHHGRRQAVCRCDIFAASGRSETLCATAQGTIRKVSSSVSPD
ncbi:PaaI family thioesterase [Candidatus Palauibacter sp.]|uniref:PaaI family thioesterase n=1 Tax=Candidatus Palauibacter sp. TaxID=3101350 RepID=UPI003B01F85C